MRKFVAIAAVVAGAATTAVLMPAAAHAGLSSGNLTICSVGSHSDVLVSPATTLGQGAAGPATFSIAKDTCSDLTLSVPNTATQFEVSLARNGRTPIYGPSTANDGGNFSFGEQPFDHTTVKYTALPPGGMSYNTDSPRVTVTVGNGNASQGNGAEVDFVYSNQLH
jgi:hypothetical protein